MKRLGNSLGLIVLAGVLFYGYSLMRQLNGIETLCARHGAGTRLDSPQSVADRYAAKVMGPYAIDGKLDERRYIFCASLTLCDVSCTIDMSSTTVIAAEYVSR